MNAGPPPPGDAPDIIVTPPPPPGPPPAPVASAQFRPLIGHLPSYLLWRFFAFAVDIFGVAFILATFGYNAFNMGYWQYANVQAGRPNESGFWLLAWLSLGAALAITFISEGLFGTTLGKLLFGLVVRTTRGGYTGLGRGFTRNLLRPVDLFAIGPLLTLVTPRRQRLGDIIAGTVVSRTRFAPALTILALLVIAAIIYAQALWGGGMGSMLGLSAQTVLYVPGAMGRAVGALGSGPGSYPQPGATSSPQAGATLEPNAGATTSPLGTPVPEPTDNAVAPT